MKGFYSRITGSICILSLTLVFVGAALAQKMTTDELGAKHRASIGTKEKLDSVKERGAMGLSEFESKLPTKKTSGKDYRFLSVLTHRNIPSRRSAFSRIASIFHGSRPGLVHRSELQQHLINPNLDANFFTFEKKS